MTQEQTTPVETAPETTEAGSENGVTSKTQLMLQVQEVLNAVRPYLQSDGGDCELVDVTDEGVVQLRLHGACGTCPSSIYTLKLGIEEQLKQHVPGITAVESVM